MSNSIRAAALDAAIVATIEGLCGFGASLGELTGKLMDASLHGWRRVREFRREVRHRLQRLQSAGAIKQSGRGKWVVA